MKSSIIVYILILSLYAGVISGCSSSKSPYSYYYKPASQGTGSNFETHLGKTEFVKCPTSEWGAAVDRYIQRGYVVVGEASFEANRHDYDDSLRAKAKEVQADIVVVSESSAGSKKIVVPMLNYQPGQTQTTYTAGQIGGAQFHGISTATTPGTLSTSYVPMEIQRGNYGATFLRKGSIEFGARVVSLSDGQRVALQRNGGVSVQMIVDESPAYFANIVPGDIIITVDGDPVTTADKFREQLQAKDAKLITLKVIRGSAEKSIEVQLKTIGRPATQHFVKEAPTGLKIFSIDIPSGKLPAAAVHDFVVRSVVTRDWLVDKDDSDRIVISIDHRKVAATVTISFTEETITAYCDRYNGIEIKAGGVIPKKIIGWMENLEGDFRKCLK